MGTHTYMDMPKALETLRNVACMREGERITQAGIDAAAIIYHAYKLLQERVEELDQHIVDLQSCVVCSGLLLPSDSPPHCEDCHPDEDQEISWARKIRKWDEELERNSNSGNEGQYSKF